MKNRYISICLTLLIAISGKTLAAKDKTDSLLAAIQFASEKEQIVLNNVIAWKTRNSNPEESYRRALSGLKLASRYYNSQQIAFSYNILGLYHSYRNTVDSALYYFNLQIVHSEKNRLDDYKGYALQNIGNLYYRRANYSEALIYYQMVDDLYGQLGNFYGRAKANTNIGLVHFELGDYPEALQHYYKALELYRDSVRSQQGYGALLNNIGDVFYELQVYDKALEYYQQSTALNQKFKDQRRLCTSLRLTGRTYAVLKKFDQAGYFLDEAKCFAEHLRDPVAVIECVKEKANLFLMTKQPDQSRKLISKYKKMLMMLDSKALVSEVCLLLGKAYFLQGNFLEGEKVLLDALHLAESTGSLNVESQINQLLFEIYSASGQYKAASIYAKRHIDNKKKLMDESVLKTVMSQQKYEQEKNEKQIATIKLEKAELIEERERKKRWFTVMLSVFIIILLLTVFLIILMSHRQKSLRIYHKMQNEVNRQRVINMEREQEIRFAEAQIKGEENERNRIARELHDGVGGALGGIKLMLAGRKEDNTDNKDVEQLIDSLYTEVRNISHNLTSPALRDRRFSQVIGAYLDNMREKCNFVIQSDFYPEDDIDSLSEDLRINLYRMLQELLNNINKHAFASEVTIQLIVHSGYLNLLVEDDGVGFEPDKTGRGIGLGNISQRVKILGGTIEIDSHIGKGTVTNIYIPLIKSEHYERTDQRTHRG